MSELPSELKVGAYAEARVNEINNLKAILSQPCQGQGAAQQLARHLRRRAVSHNPNRLPRRLRDRHIAEREKSNNKNKNAAKKQKKPSRKNRRRPKNLLQEYNRRQKDNIWLETHIWHAKRFHMIAKYGYKIPDYPNDKSFRATFRAVSKKCLMRDVSYYCCLEIQGQKGQVVDEICQFLNPKDVGRLRENESFIRGQIEEKLWLFHPGKFPRGAIGKACLMCKPCNCNHSGSFTMWIWLHPAYYEEFKESFLLPFREETKPLQEPPSKKFKSTKDVNLEKIRLKNVPIAKAEIFTSKSGNLKVIPLKDTLIRFRLVGPLSGVVLKNCLKKSPPDNPDQASKSGSLAESSSSNPDFVSEMEIDAGTAEKPVRNDPDSLVNPAQMRSSSIIGFTVRDPRILLPPKRDGIRNAFQVEQSPQFDYNVTDFWNSDLRDRTTLEKCPDSEVNRRRSQRLVPGSELPWDESESEIPCLVVHQPGDRSGFGSGYDLILPAGWATSFWLSLYFNGARIGGQREAKQLALETLIDNDAEVILDSVDTKSGISETETEAESLKNVHLRYPPAKRCNFAKLGIKSPFKPLWKQLIKDWTGLESSSDLFVFRGDLKDIENQCEALVPVSLEVCGKGNFGPNSVICLPNDDDDLENTIEEPLTDDSNESERKKIRQNHSKEKKFLRRKWKRIKESKNLNPDDLNEVKVLRDTKNEIYNAEMGNLWFPDPESVDGIRDSCSRKVVGFVVNGGFSQRRGKAAGVGFIVGEAFKLIQINNLALVRDPKSNVYRKVNVKIRMK